MCKLKWDEVGKRLYETGTAEGVLYVQSNDGTYPKGVAWNGLRAVTETPSGAETTTIYANNSKYADLVSKEIFGGKIEAYTYPEEWAACDGSAELVPGVTLGQQGRKSFGLAYKTLVGNDVQNNKYGYKIHLIYGCKATPSERSYQSENESPEAIKFSWDVKSTPVSVPGFDPTSILTIDSTKVAAEKLAALEAILYGTDGQSGAEGTQARLPFPEEVAEIIGIAA